MADVLLLGRIIGVRYTENGAVVTVCETKRGYKKSDGTIVNDELLTWKVVYKAYFKSYIAKHFGENMLVKIKGILLPYEKDGEGNTIKGFTIIGETINKAAYQNANLRVEKAMMKESQEHSLGTPDLAAYEEPDF